MAAVRHLAYSKFALYYHNNLFSMTVCFILQKFAKIRRSLAVLCPNAILKMTAVRHLEL